MFLGPHRYNKCPLRRIAQAFVIATKTKIGIHGVSLPDNLTDEYFKRADSNKEKRSTENEIFAEKKVCNFYFATKTLRRACL